MCPYLSKYSLKILQILPRHSPHTSQTFRKSSGHTQEILWMLSQKHIKYFWNTDWTPQNTQTIPWAHLRNITNTFRTLTGHLWNTHFPETLQYFPECLFNTHKIFRKSYGQILEILQILMEHLMDTPQNWGNLVENICKISIYIWHTQYDLTTPSGHMV